METRAFGNSGSEVSILGFGAGHIGGNEMSDADASQLLNAALDLGITLIDTAKGYGLSEERIGRAIAHRRSEFVLSTKGGYGVDGVPDWTGECIARGIDEARARLRAERIDVFHLHSCDEQTLNRDDIVRVLDDARNAGKIGISAYSGENEALSSAIDRGVFGSIQCSVNVADQRSIDREIARAHERGLGVIGKRPLANAPWRFQEQPHGNYAETYWNRLRAMNIDLDLDTAIRFSAFAPGVSSVIVGTSNIDHLRTIARALEQGPLAADHLAHLREAFRTNDRDWRGEI
jgi:aryl-alcohol dehydrogenase-like predicted oxidoreductase